MNDTSIPQAKAKPSTIRLTGGRGTVEGEIVHANPNYTFVVALEGSEITVPADLIADVLIGGAR